MKKQLTMIMTAVLWVGGTGVQGGTLEPPNAPGPTMRTLEEVYQKLLSNERKQREVEELLTRAGIGEPPPLVIPELVTVGDAGNPGDTGVPGRFGIGTVHSEYKMGRYEVTNAEYAAFLNAVDPGGVNRLALYNANMNTAAQGGIRNDVGGVYGSRYVVKEGFADKPVIYVTFYDAVRFCNWLHNGAAAGADTESGAYTLDGGTVTPSNTLVARNAGARFTLPTLFEWYKAAYYEPGGDIDSYWLFPTRGNSAPSAGHPPGTAPAANYSSVVNALTDVGAYATTVGYYGTYDMAGNVQEWTETRIGTSIPFRVLRGGSWQQNDNAMRSSSEAALFNPIHDHGSLGFRISSP